MKRDPDSFAAIARSSPGFTPGMSKCSTGWKSSARGSPQRRISTLSSSSLPKGTSSSGRFGISASRAVSVASSSAACAFSAATSAFFSATSARRRSNSASSPRPLAAPTSFEARFCSACAVSAARIFARRLSSIDSSSPDSGASPRRARAASKAAGFSRMARMSCIVVLETGAKRLGPDMHQSAARGKAARRAVPAAARRLSSAGRGCRNPPGTSADGPDAGSARGCGSCPRSSHRYWTATSRSAGSQPLRGCPDRGN